MERQQQWGSCEYDVILSHPYHVMYSGLLGAGSTGQNKLFMLQPKDLPKMYVLLLIFSTCCGLNLT